MAVSAPPPLTATIDDGVIEEARRPQRRRRVGATGALGPAVSLAVGLTLALGGGGSGRMGQGPLFRPPRLSFVHGLPYVNGRLYPLAVRPALDAGQVVLQVNGPGEGGGGSYPREGTPLIGTPRTLEAFHAAPALGPGEIDYFLTEADVASVRFSGLGTFRTVELPDLPPGLRAVVFFKPYRISTTLTPLDADGQPIPIRALNPQPLHLPNIYWQDSPNVPRRGRCAVQSHMPGTITAWGQVTTQIAPDHRSIGPAFFTCIDIWYRLARGAFQAAVLLNAQHPGAPPAPLWGATPIPGHPGLVQVPPIQQSGVVPAHRLSPAVISRATARLTRRLGRARAQEMIRLFIARARVPHRYTDSIAPGIVARRVGNAWLLVEYGSLAQQIAFLKTLTITRLDIPPDH
jgi:hypothetical protein